MKSMILRELGGKLDLLNIPDPIPEKNKVLIKVLSCGLNFADTLLIQGKYQLKPNLPFAPGLEVCGIIERINCTSSELSLGDRVIAIVEGGGLSEKVTASYSSCFKVPDGMTNNEAAGFLIAYGTGYLSLKDRAKLKSGENLLVLGASGGIGLTAVELGKALGATVIAVASDTEKLEKAKELGATYLFENSDENLVHKIKSIGGADVIYDPVGGTLFEKVFRASNQCARIIPIGFASGTVPQVPLNIVMVKNIDVIGVHWSAYQKFNLDGFRKNCIELINLRRSYNLGPLISDVFPLKKSNEALEIIRQRKAKGKVVVEMAI